MREMKCGQIWRFLISFILLLKVRGTLGQPPTTSTTTTESTRDIRLKFHKDHRSVQWCVNGVDEPEFKVYPWSEFSPILQRRYHAKFLTNVRYKYSVDLRPIKLKAAPRAEIGHGQVLLQRAHFVFRAQLRREFRYNVKTSYNESNIEGLLVQVNYAPMGVGLPAVTQFVHPKDFNCYDCDKPIGIPIACRKRTYFHTVHPTLLAYHHKMKVPEEERKRRKVNCINRLIPNQCILSGFKDLDDNLKFIGKPVEQGSKEIRKMFNWKKDPVAGTLLQDHVNRPHPEITTTCKETKDCENVFKDWFKTSCCLFVEGQYCNRKTEVLNLGSSTTTTTTARAPAPAGPKAEITPLCPNRPYQAPAGAPGHSAKHYDANATVYVDPTEQSLNWPVFQCKPFYTTVCREPNYDTVADVPWETQEQLKLDFSVAGTRPAATATNPFKPATQCCMGIAPGQTCPAGTPSNPKPGVSCPAENPTASPPTLKTECIPRVVLPYNQITEQEATPPNTAACEDLLSDEHFPLSSQVHGNLVWYSPPCHYTSTVRFQLLVVHSFTKGVYSIFDSEDYYTLNRDHSDHSLNPHIPSPLFTGFPHECEASSSADYLYTTSNLRTNFDYSRSYDNCIQEIGDDINHQVCVAESGVPAFVPLGRKKDRKFNPPIPKCDIQADASKFRGKPCRELCPELPSTTIPTPTTEAWNPIKRSLHGGINIITNFCIMPICVFIARFYKETYNLQIFKGQRTWFWMHMIGSGGSTVLMYLGYFTKKIVDLNTAHVVYGNIYIVCLGISYCTSWMRHKKRIISSIMEITHSGCGYSSLVLALICVNNATLNGEPINNAVVMVVYIALCSLTIFYLGMTMHICSLDKKFGMKPRRWHFPIVESRFEDLPIPGRRVRQFFLFTLLLVNLPLTISTLFL